MLNLYSCGCHAEGDFSALSRCADHNGYIVATLEHARSRQVIKSGSLTVWHDTLLNNLRRLKDQTFDHIFAYPEHDWFYAMQFMTPSAWRDQKMELFYHIRRLLKPHGYATLIVDYYALHTVLYQSEIHGFDVSLGKPLCKEFIPEPLYAKAYQFTDAKATVNLWKGERQNLPEFGATVLDVSSILLDRTMRRAKDNRVLALCGCPHRFRLIKENFQ